MEPLTKVKESTAEGVTVVNEDGSEAFYAADTVP
jgi:hypothetical protein